MRRRADGAASPVRERAMRFLVDGVAPAFGWMLDGELRQHFSDAWGVMIGLDLGVDCHAFSLRETWG